MHSAGQHPPPPPTPFVGNADALSRATEALARPSHAVALVGPPGSGKTSLAAMLASRLADRFEGEPLWIDCERHLDQRPTPTDLASAVLDLLGYESSSLARSELVELMKERLRDSHVLVVLDGVEDEGQVRDLVPGADWGSSLIVSSRNNLGQIDIPRVDLDRLPVTEGVELLRETAGHPAALEDETLSTALVAAAGGLPLAIRMVGSQIASGASPEALLHSLRSESARLSLVASESDPGSLQSALTTTYEALSVEGEELFRLIGLLTADSFTAADLERELGLPPSSIGELRELAAFGLLEAYGGRYRLHPLIRRFAREQLGREGLNSEAARLARSHLEDPVFKRLDREERRPETSPDSLDEHVAAQEYALRVATEAGDQHAVARALSNLGTLYANRGQLDDAHGTFHAALSVANAIADLDLGARLNLALGRVEREQGELDSAERRIRTSLEMFETGGDAEGRRIGLIYLGDLLLAESRTEDAEAAYDGALEIHGDGQAIASVLGRKGLLASRDDPSAARKLYEAALEAIGPDGDEIERAALLRQLGIMLLREGDAGSAAERLHESFYLFRQGGHARRAAVAALTIGGTMLIAGDADQAQSWLTEAESSAKRVQDDPQLTAVVAFASALVAEAQGRWDQAQPLQEEAMSWFRKVKDRVGEAHSLLTLGALLERSGDREEAAVVIRLGEKLLEEQDEGRLSPQEALLQMVLR